MSELTRRRESKLNYQMSLLGRHRRRPIEVVPSRLVGGDSTDYSDAQLPGWRKGTVVLCIDEPVRAIERRLEVSSATVQYGTRWIQYTPTCTKCLLSGWTIDLQLLSRRVVNCSLAHHYFVT